MQFETQKSQEKIRPVKAYIDKDGDIRFFVNDIDSDLGAICFLREGDVVSADWEPNRVSPVDWFYEGDKISITL